MKKLLAAFCSFALCIVAAFAVACDNEDREDAVKPEKLKDGIALTITEGESKTIDLSEYISIEGTEYAYTVNSSEPDVATVSLDGSTATVVAVAEGTATVTASADEVEVSFAVTVNAKQQIPPKPVEADKTALAAEIALEVPAQGDYTAVSFEVYKQKLQTAKTVNAKADATQSEVDTACNELKTAREKLALRVPEEVKGAEKNIVIFSGLTKEITIADYIDAKNLSSITYEVSSAGALITCGEIKGGKFTVTAGKTEEDADVAVSIKVKYKGETKLTVKLTLQVKKEAQPTLKQPQVTQSVDIYSLENKTEFILDFAQNIETNGVQNLTYSVTSDGKEVALDSNNRLTYNLDGEYSEEVAEAVFNVTVNYGENKKISYGYTLKITDTTAYRVINGGFDNGLDGWTMVGDIGEISEKDTFWDQNFDMFNKGKYFLGNDKEGNKGSLTSSEFKVGGINKISFRLGAAGNSECYITLETTDGTVLAIWRNTKFEDVGVWDKEEIGKTQFACNLVTYVADLSAYSGKTLKIVLRDNAEDEFGFFNFDELVTYYATEDELPEGVTAVNFLADKSELEYVLDNVLTAHGDYTEESYNAYLKKVQSAQAIFDKLTATQEEIDGAVADIETAFNALEVRKPEEKADAEKSFRLLAGNSKELSVYDYVDEKDLSSLTYSVEAEKGITVSEIEDGIFTVTAGNDEAETSVTITVRYKETDVVLKVTILVAVTSEDAPVLKKTSVENEIDVYFADNKTDITIDFSENVENIGGLELEYAVTLDGNSLTLDGTSYTYTYGSYTETAEEVVFTVTVSFSHNGETKTLEYNYTLKLKDTTEYRITNGGFDDGLDGWTLSNGNLGGVNADETYWKENISFNNDGNFFNAYYFDGEGKENATGALTSETFILGGSGWITYKLGGAKNADKVFLDIVEKDTGAILARYYNNSFSNIDGNAVRGCTLIDYKAKLSEQYLGKTVYIRISDNGIDDFGLFFVDSFETYYAEEPAGDFTEAVEITERPQTIYDILNGGFESDLYGWTLLGSIGAVTSDKGYWNNGNPEDTTKEYGKEGEKLFSWWSWDSNANEGAGAEVNREGNLGTLTSNMFVLKAGKYVSFLFGGGKYRNVYIELVNAESGSIIAVFRNDDFEDGKLKSYSYKVDELTEETLCYFRITDNAVKDWGCFTADGFKVNLDSAPEGSKEAVNHRSEYSSMVNGSFETGNLDGWTMGEKTVLGAVTNTEKAESWYQTNENTKDGDYLFTFYYHNGTEYVNVEENTGIIRSSTFILEKNGIISFRLGAAKNSEVYINVYTTGGRLLATFRNNAYEADTVMVQYYYQFDNDEEISCYFEVVDNATREYGCIVMDDFRVNLDAAPENAVLGSDKIK